MLTGLIKTKIHQHADVMSLPSYWGSKCGVVNHYPSLRGNISVSQRLNVNHLIHCGLFDLFKPADLGAGASLS